MSLREHLRMWLGIEDHNGPNDPDEHDEDILNVLRRELQNETGREELTTGEISSKLTIQSTQTHNRLEDLKKEHRVTKRRAGQTDMWQLAPTETTEVINPRLGDVVRRSSQVRRISKPLWEAGRNFAVIGFIFMLIGMTSLVSDISPPIITWQMILALGYLFGLFGGGIVAAAGILKLIGVGSPRIAELYLVE